MTTCHQFSGQSLLIGSKNTCLEMINDLQIHRRRGEKQPPALYCILGLLQYLEDGCLAIFRHFFLF